MRAGLIWSYAVQSIVVAASVYTEELCTTRLGPSSVRNFPSSTVTSDILLTAFKKIRPTRRIIITPSPVKSIVTTTTTFTVVTTAPQLTDVVTRLLTKTDLSFITFTTFTTTTIVSTPTSTVPTPAGFTPISQERGYVPKRNKRDISGRLAPRRNFVSRKKTDKGGNSPAAYPTFVSCVEYIKSVTTKTITVSNRVSTKTTILAVSTTFKTSIITATVTRTVFVPDAISTITASTTLFPTTTTTKFITLNEISTETITSIAPSATFYAACAKNNVLKAANGGVKIVGLSFSSDGFYNTVLFSSAATPYKCCVACQQTANCVGTIFYPHDMTVCYLVTTTTCNPRSSFGTAFFTSTKNGLGYIVSNGPCGQIPNGGPAFD